MKRIAILSNSAMGLYSFRRELIEKLLQDGHEVVIFAPKEKKTDYFIQLGCGYVETRINRRGINPISDLLLFVSYYRQLKKIKPDIVLTYTIKPNIYGGIVCSLLDIPYISNITGFGSALEKNSWLRYVTLTLYKLSMKKVKCIFFQNEENQQFFLNNIYTGVNHKLIPGSGVNLNHFQVLDYPQDDNIHFLFIGRIMREKGIDHYLEAAEYIKEKYPNTFFHVLGNCEESYQQILEKKEKQGIIQYHGRQDDVREFHKISHCTIHPSFYFEGMSNVLLESAACGRPLITTNRSGCREVVDDGENGFLVNPKDTKDLVDKIEKFIKLDHGSKKEMGMKSRKKVESMFDRNIVISAYLEQLYDI